MKILVTGGAGFIASHLADSLLEYGYKVIVVDNLRSGKTNQIPIGATFFCTDILDPSLEQAFLTYTPDIVYHYAAQIDVKISTSQPELDAMTNVVGTLKVLELCKKYEVKKIVYASTAAVYGDAEHMPISEDHINNPISFYGISKYTPEMYIELYSRLYGLDYTIFRYANVYGTRQNINSEAGVIPIFLNKLLNRERPVIYGDGEHTRDFLYVRDVITANLLALSQGSRNTYNVSNNRPTTINELLRLMCELTGRPFDPIYSNPRLDDIVHSNLDNRKVIEQLRWTPEYNLRSGLSEIVNYYCR